MQKSTAVVSLEAIRKNARFVKSLLNGKKFYAVVKADAYGHGAAQVAHALSDIADAFCVAITDEGEALRIAGIDKEILVFTPPLSRGDVARAESYNLTLTVNGIVAARLSRGLPCHIKVNTGMNRVGCSLSELAKILKILSSEQIKGVYSHIYAPCDELHTRAQLEAFKSAVALVKSENSDICAHFSASAGILMGGKYLFDGARAGILLYGYCPSGFSAPVIPAMKIYAPRVQRTSVFGYGVGYKQAEKKYKTLATYRYGYADGAPRRARLGESPLCMDGFVSRDVGKFYLLDDAGRLAEDCGTISYEILCSAARRCRIVYEN